MKKPQVSVKQESPSGRNTKFHDNIKNIDMTRPQFIKEIEKGEYSNYHVRVINGVKTPVSNPDKKPGNNLG
ncbi:hypothetical protein L4D15_17005 [Enterovibrio norvegicus]|uniref:hypothetical protein n=1 Tax=Enterovibrio norvegicus TaxID=188144 RepID=UPI003D0FC0A9